MGWKIIGGSVTGKAHITAGIICQDSSGWRAADRDVRLVVADGAGSRLRSAEGAQVAVEYVLHWPLPGASPSAASLEAALRQMIGDTRDAIKELATGQGYNAREYATTIAAGIITEEFIAVAQVGDTIAIAGSSGQYKAIEPAAATEYVNETTFITDDDAVLSIRLSILPAIEIEAVILSTDGLRFKILEDLGSGAPFVPFFEDLVGHARGAHATDESICQFLSSVDDQSGDDKSLVVAVRME